MSGRASLLAFSLLACADTGQRAAGPSVGSAHLRVQDDTPTAFSQPLPGLDEPSTRRFFVGNSFFNQNWVSAPASVPARDGLGPLFNARSCSGCHFRDGRGRPPEEGAPGQGYLVRLSVSPAEPPVGDAPDPVYGSQLQDQAVPGARAEAHVEIRYGTVTGHFADGAEYTLRKPEIELRDFGHGPPSPGLRVSARVAPHLAGLGLLAEVPNAALEALADPDDRDGDGVSGRVAKVWDVVRGTHQVGRFGWKAEQPSLEQQTAAAFSGDMGLTTALYPEPSHTAAQRDAASLPSGGEPEVDARVLGDVVAYVASLAVPASRPSDVRGGALFHGAGCARCHVPALPSPRGELAAYTDLLLHDLGDGLSDGRPAGDAGPSEWRTPPLWGVGLVQTVNGHTRLLHDGRARGVAEAVLWHAGEANASRIVFLSMSADERTALCAFVESL